MSIISPEPNNKDDNNKNTLAYYACGHCQGVGCHDNNPIHVCIACQRTGLLPPHPDNPSNIVTPSKRSKELYNQHINNPEQTFRIKNQDHLIVISGVGIAGAATALALQQRGFKVICFERDTHFNQRQQGYGLTIQQGTMAIKGLGLSSHNGGEIYHITKHNAFNADGTVLGSYGLEQGAEFISDKKKAPKHNMIITRQDLRQQLVDNLLPNTIRWGVSVIGYTEDEQQLINPDQTQVQDPLLTIHLSNGEVLHHVDLLIGCEGIRSILRKQKLQLAQPLNYLNVFVVLGISPHNNGIDTDEYKNQLENYNQRSYVNQASDAFTRVYSMPFDKDAIMWQLSFPMNSFTDAVELQSQGPRGWLDKAQSLCADWKLPYILPLLQNSPVHTVTGYPAFDRDLPTLQQLRDGVIATDCKPENEQCLVALAAVAGTDQLDGNDDDSELVKDNKTNRIVPSESPNYHRTFTSSINSNKRVTFCGDSCHPGSPFKAQGANQAILDAIYCARALTPLFNQHGKPSLQELDIVLGNYEAEMIKRTTPKVHESRANVTLLHSQATLTQGDLPRAWVAKQQLLQEQQQHQSPPQK